MAPGFLIVFSEPGEQVTLDEFQDWYNNEHVPLRLDHLPSFLTGARYFSDFSKPSWVAVYDVDDVTTFSDPSYTRLRANRSPREANLVKRLELLDRRTCQLIADSGESPSTSSYHPRNPSPFINTFGVISPNEEQVKRAVEDKNLLGNTDGWLRTRGYRVIDNLKSGVGVRPGVEAQKVPPYLIVIGEYPAKPVTIQIHTLPETSVAPSSALSSVLGQELAVEEESTWQIYRAYPSIAQQGKRV